MRYEVFGGLYRTGATNSIVEAYRWCRELPKLKEWQGYEFFIYDTKTTLVLTWNFEKKWKEATKIQNTFIFQEEGHAV